MQETRRAPIHLCRLLLRPLSLRTSHSSACLPYDRASRVKRFGYCESIVTLKSGAPTNFACRIAGVDILLAALFDQFCHETGPAGLMARADPGTIVAMKGFVEKDEVAPVRITLKKFNAASHGPASARIAKKNMNEPPGDFRGYLPEIRFGAGIRRALHFEIFAVVMVKFLQRFHQQIVDGEPDRSAPV